MREKIAWEQHAIWAHWMEYLFSVCDDYNGIIVIPTDKVKRWKKQMKTPYHLLPEKEKESDRHQADKIIEAIETWNTRSDNA